MRSIKFQYSLNAGTSWSTAVTVRCKSVRCYLMPQIETEGSQNRTSDAAICQKSTARHMLEIVVAENDLDPAQNTSGTTNFLALQKWCCAPMRYIYNADTATNPTIDGWDLWDTDSTSRDYYLILDGEPTYEFQDLDAPGASARKIRSIVIKCMTRKSYTVT